MMYRHGDILFVAQEVKFSTHAHVRPNLVVVLCFLFARFR